MMITALRTALFGLLILLMSGTAFADVRKLVLVTGDASPSPELSSKEVRWLFMGLPVVKEEQRIEPLLNASDELIYEVFLQKVIYMSAQNYERRLLTKVFRLGGRRPEKYHKLDRLLGDLQAKPNAVSFMWRDAAERNADIKIVSELWSGNIE